MLRHVLFTVVWDCVENYLTYTVVIARGRETSLWLEGLGFLWVRSRNYNGGDEGSEDIGALHFDDIVEVAAIISGFRLI